MQSSIKYKGVIIPSIVNSIHQPICVLYYLSASEMDAINVELSVINEISGLVWKLGRRREPG